MNQRKAVTAIKARVYVGGSRPENLRILEELGHLTGSNRDYERREFRRELEPRPRQSPEGAAVHVGSACNRGCPGERITVHPIPAREQERRGTRGTQEIGPGL